MAPPEKDQAPQEERQHQGDESERRHRGDGSCDQHVVELEESGAGKGLRHEPFEADPNRLAAESAQIDCSRKRSGVEVGGPGLSRQDEIALHGTAAAGITTANTPENMASVGFNYLGERFRLGLHYRWSDAFDWRSGVHVGRVPSFEVMDIEALFEINDRFRIGVDVDNVLDDEHYEVFGGDLLERRALVYAAVTW